jgi:hypothetical protein
MLKMRDVYIQNTALGDPATLDKQLEENAQQLDKLKQELHKFEVNHQGFLDSIGIWGLFHKV